MHLLNVFTGRLEEYFGSQIPSYAILSHTWGLEEVTFLDIQNISSGHPNSSTGTATDHQAHALSDSSTERKIFEAVHPPSVQRKSGYAKIRYACRQAILDSHTYVWIDTCCIDKSSSAELTEAINSMFRWYQDAAICYAYLEDIMLEKGADLTVDSICSSKWFTRGWTLQELLAPEEVKFFGSPGSFSSAGALWIPLGTKFNLADEITSATGIDQASLLVPGQLNQKSIAQRMSWAAKRRTTRPEDMAYCLLGIFGVTMPLLYGEGQVAFFRLQEEIMKYSDDQSLFAWSTSHGTQVQSGIFAPSPANFETRRAIVPIRRRTHTSPYSMTNKGLQIELPLIEIHGITLGLLDCQYEDDFSRCVGIWLKKTQLSEIYLRSAGQSTGDTTSEEKLWVSEVTPEQALTAKKSTIYIQRDNSKVPLERTSYQVKAQSLTEYGFELVYTRPSHRLDGVHWNDTTHSLQISRPFGSGYTSISFVFYSSESKTAFGVYFDESPPGTSTTVCFSPSVHAHDQTLDNWFHSLSYGIDHESIAHPRLPSLFCKQRRGDGSTSMFEVLAVLEAVNHFGQQGRVVRFSTRTITNSRNSYSFAHDSDSLPDFSSFDMHSPLTASAETESRRVIRPLSISGLEVVNVCQTETTSTQLPALNPLRGTKNGKHENELGSTPRKQSGNAQELIDWVEVPK
jgi:hypothetical protein